MLWSAPLLESLSRCQLGVRHSPRVTIAVPARGSALSSSHYRGANPWVQQTGLVCRTHTPVAIVVQSRGSTSSSSRYRGSNRGRDSRWQMGGCVNIHGVRIQVSVVVQTGGESNVSQPLLESLSWWQPRGVTTRVVIRGGRRTVRVVLAVYAVGFNPVV